MFQLSHSLALVDSCKSFQVQIEQTNNCNFAQSR